MPFLLPNSTFKNRCAIIRPQKILGGRYFEIHDRQRSRRSVPEILRGQRAFDYAEFFADTRKRPNAFDDWRGNGTAQAVFHRKAQAALPASDDESALRADGRHRKRRANCAASYGVHDVGKFLVRRLF